MEKKEHPFPAKEINLLMKLNRDQLIPIEDISLISGLIDKYLKLRSEVFYDE